MQDFKILNQQRLGWWPVVYILNGGYANFLEIIPAGELCSSGLVQPPHQSHVTSPQKTSTFVKAWQASD